MNQTKSEKLTVDFMPTCHTYQICHIPKEHVECEEPQQFCDALSEAGTQGLLLVSMYPNPAVPDHYTLVFARTGVIRPEIPSNIIPLSGGIIGPNGKKL